MFVFLKVGFI